MELHEQKEYWLKEIEAAKTAQTYAETQLHRVQVEIGRIYIENFEHTENLAK